METPDNLVFISHIRDYMGVQLPIVWQTVQEDIPSLLKITQEILDAQ